MGHPSEARGEKHEKKQSDHRDSHGAELSKNAADNGNSWNNKKRIHK